MKTSLILFFTLLLSVLTSCPANYNPADIRTGYVVASTVANVDANIRGASTSYVYQFNTTINGSPQIAIATNMIEGPLRSDQVYSVSATGSSSQISFVFTISFASANWFIMKIGFLAQTRTDMETGIFQLNGLISQARTFNQGLQRSISDSFVRTFIAGFSVGGSASSVNFEVINATVSGNSLVVAATSSNVNLVWLSYIVYSSSSLQATYLVSSGSVGLGLSNANFALLEAGTTSLYGFSEFTSSSGTYFDIDSRLSSQLQLNSQTKTLSSATIDYLIIQNLPKSYCSSCNSGKVYEQGYCVDTCGSDSVPIISEGTQMCLICDIQSYLIISPDKTSCVCAVQFYQPQGSPSCQSCHSSCITCTGPSANNCASCDTIPSVSTNKVLVNSSCVCLQRFYQDSTNSFFCLPCHYSCLTCSNNNISNCLTCSINLGRIKSGNSCECTNGYRDDGVNEKCACINMNSNGVCQINITCQSNQVNVNNTCQCRSGFFNISGSCSQCQNNNYFNGAACVACSNGTVTGNGTLCTCSNGFFNISGKCQRCGTNEVYSNTSQVCNCASGFYRVSGTCQRPPANMTYNGTAFVCSTGLYNISGRCTVCTGDQVYNQTTKTCVCPVGTTLRNNRCQKNPTTPNVTNCGVNSYFNGRTCVCNNGFYNISNSCTTCPQGAYYNSLTCVCPQNMFINNSACTSCPQGATYNGNTCICPFGQTYVNNTCRASSTTNTTNNTNSTTGNRVTLSVQGYMRFTGYIVARIAVSYIPPAYLANNCAACSNLLNVTVTGGAVRPSQIAFSFTAPNIINIFFGFNFPTPQPFTATVRLISNNFYNGYIVPDPLNLNITNAVISSATG